MLLVPSLIQGVQHLLNFRLELAPGTSKALIRHEPEKGIYAQAADQARTNPWMGLVYKFCPLEERLRLTLLVQQQAHRGSL